MNLKSMAKRMGLIKDKPTDIQRRTKQGLKDAGHERLIPRTHDYRFKRRKK